MGGRRLRSTNLFLEGFFFFYTLSGPHKRDVCSVVCTLGVGQTLTSVMLCFVARKGISAFQETD